MILLSARAGGEEARVVEGAEAGADDYLTTPFSARELLARVDSHLKMARFRREVRSALRASEERFAALANLELAGPRWRNCSRPRGRFAIRAGRR